MDARDVADCQTTVASEHNIDLLVYAANMAGQVCHTAAVTSLLISLLPEPLLLCHQYILSVAVVAAAVAIVVAVAAAVKSLLPATSSVTLQESGFSCPRIWLLS